MSRSVLHLLADWHPGMLSHQFYGLSLAHYFGTIFIEVLPELAFFPKHMPAIARAKARHTHTYKHARFAAVVVFTFAQALREVKVAVKTPSAYQNWLVYSSAGVVAVACQCLTCACVRVLLSLLLCVHLVAFFCSVRE